MSLFAKKVRTDTVNSRKGSIRFGERYGTEERIEKQPYRSRVASTLLFLLSKENMEVLFYVAACHYTTYDRNGKQCVCVWVGGSRYTQSTVVALRSSNDLRILLRQHRLLEWCR